MINYFKTDNLAITSPATACGFCWLVIAPVSKKGGDIRCQKKTRLGLQVKAEGHVMVEVAGKAVHREKAQVLKPVAKRVAKRENANQRVNLTP